MLKIRHSIENENAVHTEVKQTEPYIIFTVNNEEFGVEADRVLELIKYTAPFKMPNNFFNVNGMTIFRGNIIPVIDLRVVFGLESIEYDDYTVTIIIESSVSVYGVVAERVLDLNLIPVTSIKKVTTFNFGEKTKYLKSVANFEERLILLLDLDKTVERTQTTFAEPIQPQSLTKVETSDIFLKTEGEDKPVKQPEEAQMEPKLSSSYLIDPKELEDLLNETTQKSELQPESKLSPMEGNDSNVTGRLSKGVIDPMELKEVLAEFERENIEENQTIYQLEDKLGNGSSDEGINEIQAIPKDGILESEQVEEILFSLESDLTPVLPEDLAQKKIAAEIAIDPNQTKQGLSDEIIEDIINVLEAELETNLKVSSSGNDNQNLKLNQNKAPEEKLDV